LPESKQLPTNAKKAGEAEADVVIDLPTWEGLKADGAEAWMALAPKRRKLIAVP